MAGKRELVRTGSREPPPLRNTGRLMERRRASLPRLWRSAVVRAPNGDGDAPEGLSAMNACPRADPGVVKPLLGAVLRFRGVVRGVVVALLPPPSPPLLCVGVRPADTELGRDTRRARAVAGVRCSSVTGENCMGDDSGDMSPPLLRAARSLCACGGGGGV